MGLYDTVFSGIQGTSLEEPLSALHGIYADADSAIDKWRTAGDLSCPDGCGSCCERFEPDVLPIESLYLAAYLMRDRRDLLSKADYGNPRSGCVFYDPGNPKHCTVYAGRPLICRLFGFTGVRDKEGGISFRLCRFSPGAGRREFSGSGLPERFGGTPPVMGDIASRIVSLDPDGASRRTLLGVSLRSAAEKILQLATYNYRELFVALGEEAATGSGLAATRSD